MTTVTRFGTDAGPSSSTRINQTGSLTISPPLAVASGFITGGDGLYQYKTLNSVGTCLATGYFNSLTNYVRPGDIITALTVTSPQTINETVTDVATLIVTSDVNGTVTVTDVSSGTVVMPIGSTAAQINAAMTTVAAAGGGVVELEAGAYSLSTALSVPSKVILKGQGPGVTTVTLVTGVTTVGVVKMGGVSYAEVRDMTVDGSVDGYNAVIFTTDVYSATGAGAVPSIPNVNDACSGTSVANPTYITARTGTTFPYTATLSANLTGTITAGNVTINGNVYTCSGTNATATLTITSANTTVTGSTYCKAVNVEALGLNNAHEYLFWNYGANYSLFQDCVANGQTTTPTFTGVSPDNDQQGFQISGGVDIRVNHCTSYNCAARGLLINTYESITSTDVDGCHVLDFYAFNCGLGGNIRCGVAATSGLRRVRNVTVDMTARTCVRGGIIISSLEGTGGTVPANTELWQNIVVNALVDNRDSLRNTTSGWQLGIYIDNAAVTNAVLARNCSATVKVLQGGGGSGSGSDKQYMNSMDVAHNWQLLNCEFNSPTNSNASTYITLLINATNTARIVNLRSNASCHFDLWAVGCAQLSIVNPDFSNASLNAAAGGDATNSACIYLTGTNTDVEILNPRVLSKTNGTLWMYGNHTTTGMILVNPVVPAGIYAVLNSANTHGGYDLACADEKISATTGTQTHNFGYAQPGNLGASLTVTHTRVRQESEIIVNWTAGTPQAFKVAPADGSFVITPVAAFIAGDILYYRIVY